LDNRNISQFETDGIGGPPQDIFPHIGNIKLAVVPGGGFPDAADTNPFFPQDLVYASVTNDFVNPFYYIDTSTDSGQKWSRNTLPQPANFQANNGFYASAILTSGGNIFVGGD